MYEIIRAESRDSIEELVSRTLTLPGVPTIRKDDPRFSWVFSTLLVPQQSYTTMGGFLEKLRLLATSNEDAAAYLQQVLDYVTELRAQSLEGELFGIVASHVLNPEDVGPILRELQWDGSSRRFLGESEPVSVSTHNAIRVISLGETWTPVLDKVLRHLENVIPLSIEEVGRTLANEGLVESSSFSVSGILQARDVFRHPVSIRVEGHTLVSNWSPPDRSLSGQSAHPSHSKLDNGHGSASTDIPLAVTDLRNIVRDAVISLQEGTGVARTQDVRDQIARTTGHEIPMSMLTEEMSKMVNLLILPDGWVSMLGDAKQSPLSGHIRRMLSVCDCLPVDVARLQLIRTNERYQYLSEKALETFAGLHPELDVDSGKIVAAGGRGFSITSTLPLRERMVYQALVESRSAQSTAQVLLKLPRDHSYTHGDLREFLDMSCVVANMTNNSYTALRPRKEIFAHIRAINRHRSAVPTPPTHTLAPRPSQARKEASSAVVETLDVPVLSQYTHDVEDDEDSEHIEARGAAYGNTTTVLRTIAELLEEVEHDRLRLPEIQRGYVWKNTQVRDLFDSLYRGYPVGNLLVWKTDERPASRRFGSSNQSDPQGGASQYVLDGQQRLTSIMRAMVTGEANVQFNAITESFRVAPARQTPSLKSIRLVDMYRKSAQDLLDERRHEVSEGEEGVYLERLQRLCGIKGRLIPVDTLEHYSYEEVTEVFIRVNSRGTRLKAAELAIADVAYRLPGIVSGEIEELSDRLHDRGWEFPVQFLLRLVSAVASDHVGFKGLAAATEEEIITAWRKLPQAINDWIELLQTHLWLKNSAVLPSLSNHVVPIVWLVRGGSRTSFHRMLEWFVLASAWPRYSGSSETKLDQDLRELSTSRKVDPFSVLIERHRRSRTTFRVTIGDVEAARQQSPLSLLMYLLTVRYTDEDFFTGAKRTFEGAGAALDLVQRPIFSNKDVRGVNGAFKTSTLANSMFISRAASEHLTSDNIYTIFGSIPANRLELYAIPSDRGVCRPERYQTFIQSRSRLLAEAMNKAARDLAAGTFFLDSAHSKPANDVPTFERFQRTKPTSQSSHSRPAISAKELIPLFEALEEQILDLTPGTERMTRTVYLGYRLPSQETPFASVSRIRRTALVWTLDCKLSQIRDPKAWCQDVSRKAKYGYGHTQFVIEHEYQLDYAMTLIEQAHEIARQRRFR